LAYALSTGLLRLGHGLSFHQVIILTHLEYVALEQFFCEMRALGSQIVFELIWRPARRHYYAPEVC
jgi:hypothetical protein